MNFRAEAKSETSIGLSWSPPRQESVIKYELLFREGDHGREVPGAGQSGGPGKEVRQGEGAGGVNENNEYGEKTGRDFVRQEPITG